MKTYERIVYKNVGNDKKSEYKGNKIEVVRIIP